MQRLGSKVVSRWSFFLISPIDPHRPAAGRESRLHVPPTIPDEKLTARIDAQPHGGAEDQAGTRLTAIAVVGVVMITNFEVVEREPGCEKTMDLLD